MYAESQYLQCWPFFITSAVCSGMLDIIFWAKSWLMAIHSCLISAWSLSQFLGFCLSTRFLRIDNKSSIGLRSVGNLATDPKYKCNDLRATSLSLLHCDMVLHHTGKCMDPPQIAAGLLGEVALRGHFDTILYSWQCFWTLSNHCTSCRISVCPWYFSWREVSPLLPFLTPGRCPNVFALTVCADALTSTCCQFWASSPLVVTHFRSWLVSRRQSWGLMDTLERPEAFFTAVEPLSLKFLMIR